MSNEAEGWVWRHSPFTGATFLVHLAIGDTTNDQHHNELWMSQTSLAAKCRCDRKTASRALAELGAAGFVTLLEDNSRAGKANRYRFEYPDVEVIHNTRRGGVSRPTPRTPGPTPPDTTPHQNTKNSNDKTGAAEKGRFLPGTGWINQA